MKTSSIAKFLVVALVLGAGVTFGTQMVQKNQENRSQAFVPVAVWGLILVGDAIATWIATHPDATQAIGEAASETAGGVVDLLDDPANPERQRIIDANAAALKCPAGSKYECPPLTSRGEGPPCGCNNNGTWTPVLVKKDGKCSTKNYNTCEYGAVYDNLKDTTTQVLWQCKGSVGGQTDFCTANKPKINGICSTTKNKCTKGKYSELKDTEDYYYWMCNGTANGTSAKCHSSKPNKVNGICSNTKYSCSSGTVVNKVDTTIAYKWSCKGSNGGSQTPCDVDKPGACGKTKNSCSAGKWTDVTDTTAAYKWKCANIICSLKK
ncbi:MAG: hypothetical protein WCG91_00775 [Candidatus Shapirobacteria bacterium]